MAPKASRSLIQELNTCRDLFTEDAHTLSTEQRTKFANMYNFMVRDLPQDITTSHRWRLRTVQAFLQDILSNLDKEVFFLVTQVTTITKLFRQNNLLPSMKRWWSRAEHPKRLHDVAEELWDSCAFGQPITQSQPLSSHSPDLQEPNPPDTVTRQISYKCSECPVSRLLLLHELLVPAIQSSNQWKFERNTSNEPTTDCLNFLVPNDRNQDISIALVVGHEEGLQLIESMGLSPT